jgi:AcrR family transcriptional regulator
MAAKKRDSENAVRGVRFAQNRSRETLQRILDAANEVFAEKGYSGATIAEIIRRAGIGHGTFWLYFHNKEDLVRYLLQEMIDEFATFDWYGADNLEQFPVQTLAEVENVIRGVMAVFERYSSIHPLIVQASLESEDFRKNLDELNEPFAHIIENKLKEHLEKGLCKDLDPTVTAHIILAMLEYTNLQLVNEDIKTDLDTLIHNLSVILYHTLNH